MATVTHPGDVSPSWDILTTSSLLSGKHYITLGGADYFSCGSVALHAEVGMKKNTPVLLGLQLCVWISNEVIRFLCPQKRFGASDQDSAVVLS